jgi:hypothetical protein
MTKLSVFHGNEGSISLFAPVPNYVHSRSEQIPQKTGYWCRSLAIGSLILNSVNSALNPSRSGEQHIKPT